MPKKNERHPSFFTVRTKIAVGYAVAVSIPVIGALTGLIVGNFYQRAATQKLTVTYQEQTLLTQLQVRILQNRPAKELTPFIEDAAAFQQGGETILLRIRELQGLVSQLEAGNTQPMRDFQPQLEAYQLILTEFSADLRVLMQDSQRLQSSQDYDQIERAVLRLVNGTVFSKVIDFATAIDAPAVAIEQERRIARDALLQAEALRTRIIVGSLIVSVIASSVLAFLTSQAISNPIEALTKVARQVTHDKDMSLRSDVMSHDEVGELAIALNQLIEWVAAYTQELKETQIHLIQTEKMSSLGQLVAGVAHEINNPINFIYGNLEHVQTYTYDLIDLVKLYQQSYPEATPEIQSKIEEIDLDFLQRDFPKILDSMQLGTDRIRHIVLSLRNFSRKDESEFKTVDIHEGLDSTLLILQHSLKARPERPEIQVTRNYGDLPLVDCYPGQLNQVFINILANAIDALDEMHTQVDSQNQPHELDQIEIHTHVIDSQWIQVMIADNGPGMSKEVQSRIFDPFFTTKPTGKGTGIGMSISYQIITEKHGGQITCVSHLGKGTQFMLQIPIRQKPVDPN